MNIVRILVAAVLSASVAMGGLVGTAAGVANAATGFATTKETPTPQPIPGVTLDHHDRQKLEKYLKKHPEIAVPSPGAP